MKFSRKLRRTGALVATSFSLVVATLSSVSTGANAVTFKTCVLTLPSKWAITSVAARSSYVASYDYSPAVFSGDCPSTEERGTGVNPFSYEYDYISDDIKHGYSGMTWLFKIENTNPFCTYNEAFDWGDCWYLQNWFDGFSTQGNELYHYRLDNGAPDDWWPRLGIKFVPRDTYYKGAWTGNAATENCDYVDESTCPGGYTYDNYRFVVKNNLVSKFDSPLKASFKKQGGVVKINASLDRSDVMSVYDPEGNSVFTFKEDRIKLYRNGKLLKTKKFGSLGKAKFSIRDKAGKQKYKVCVAETKRTWGKCKSFTA